MNGSSHKRQRGPRLARISGKPGWYIVWWETRENVRTITVTAKKDHGIQTAPTTTSGLLIAAEPQETSMLRNRVRPGEVIRRVADLPVNNAQALDNILCVHDGQVITIQVVSGTKQGTIKRLKKAADSRHEAEHQFAFWLASRERILPPSTKLAPQACITFNHLCNEFLDFSKSPQANFSPNTIRNYRYPLGKFIDQWGAYDIRNITPAFIGRWADTQHHRSPATFIFDATILRSVFRLAVARGYTDTNPVVSLRVRSPRKAAPQHMTDDQLSVLLQCAVELDTERLNPPAPKPARERFLPGYRAHYNTDGQYNVPRIMFLLLTGMRKSQFTSLKWDQYDPVRGTVILQSRWDHTEKSRRVTVIPIPLAAQAIIAKQPRTSEYIFPNFLGEQDRIIQFHFTDIAKRVEKRAGFHVHLHMLRHTSLTRLLQQTRNIALVREYAGHADIKTTLRYAHILDGELREATRAFTMPAIASFTGSKTTPEHHPVPCDAAAVSQPVAPQALGTA